MPVRLTPRGTRGSRLFDPPPVLKSIFMAVNIGLFRLFGRRMRIQGRPLLLLTTTGAKTGKRRQTPLGWFEDDPPAPIRGSSSHRRPVPRHIPAGT